MFLFIYADYFGLYQPGQLSSMLSGKMAPFGPVTQGVLLLTSAMLAIPSVMIFLSVALPAIATRWLNIIFGLLYIVIEALTMVGSWNYYLFYSVVEIILMVLIVWYAWRWPKQGAL